MASMIWIDVHEKVADSVAEDLKPMAPNIPLGILMSPREMAQTK